LQRASSCQSGSRVVSSVSKGWMANIADHSPFSRLFRVFVVSWRMGFGGWGLADGTSWNFAGAGQRERPPGCPDGLVDAPW
jgi:hypothetical protein